MLAEVAVLLTGVTSRYVYHRPLVWSDELASILFLWLAMLGSIIAFQRGEHMRMTVLVGKLEARGRAFLDLFAIAAGMAFLAFVVHPAYEFAQDEAYVTTPAMGIANSWRAAALPVGLGLMLLIGLLQIFRLGRLQDVFLALGLTALIVGGLALLGASTLRPLGTGNLFLFFVVGVAMMVLMCQPSGSSTRCSPAYLCTGSSTGSGSIRCLSARRRSPARSCSSSEQRLAWPGRSRSPASRLHWPMQ